MALGKMAYRRRKIIENPNAKDQPSDPSQSRISDLISAQPVMYLVSPGGVPWRAGDHIGRRPGVRTLLLVPSELMTCNIDFSLPASGCMATAIH